MGKSFQLLKQKFIYRKFEELLGRPLMRLCCFVHMVELPARRLATKLIGERLGPASRRGEVGALLSQQVELMPLVEFKVIENPDFPKVFHFFVGISSMNCLPFTQSLTHQCFIFIFILQHC